MPVDEPARPRVAVPRTFATLGFYTARSSLADVILLYLIGVFGFMLRRWGFPIASVLIAVIPVHWPKPPCAGR